MSIAMNRTAEMFAPEQLDLFQGTQLRFRFIMEIPPVKQEIKDVLLTEEEEDYGFYESQPEIEFPN